MRRQRNHLGFFEGEYIEVGDNLLFQIGARYEIDTVKFEHGPRGGGPKRIVSEHTVKGRVIGKHKDIVGQEWLEYVGSDDGIYRSFPITTGHWGRIVSVTKTDGPR